MSQGEALRAKADKKAASSGGFSFFSSSSAKYEEAHDLYSQAGNQFKIDKQWKESGDMFCKAAEMSLKGDEKDDAANDFWTASKSYKKSNPELAVASLQRTIQLYKEKGKFRQAADREKEIAQILAQEGGDLNGALEAFEAAGELYSAEDAQATANGCFKEAAELAGTLQQYDRAVKHFEQVAQASLGSALTKYSVKDYYLKAGMCWLAGGDVVSTQRALSTYEQQDPTFSSTREAKFLHGITDAFDQGDAEAFTGAVAEFDRLTKLDNWKTGILLAIKRPIAEEPSLT
ncbi:soluble NSF attachment protein [Leucosporidium creatinivorum]|uniref:Soluble NSF attachment protein n=1 Tax=Leucosporidium creatinivorum TaxID=106004 RepID=A0A1Y2ERL7_9BASI|nr:soluble NSF attachment protein [Leucosporidium creatinivorum]